MYSSREPAASGNGASWSRRAFLQAAAGCVAASALGAAAPDGPPRRPKPVRNVLFILIDDLGIMDLGVQGSTYYETPRVDGLAASGMRFTDAYAAHPTCSPTRASILTGRYPARVKLTAFIPGHERPHAPLKTPDFIRYMRDSEVTYAEAFREAGYRTCHVGKWHVTIRTGPQHHGFDEVTQARDSSVERNHEDPWCVGYYTEAIEKFMEENRDRPFLAVLSHGTVHVPLYEREERIAKYRDREPGHNGQDNPTMAAMIERMDWSVGRVLDRLRELGLEDDTAVVFTSDNGGLSSVWDAESGSVVTATSNLPYRSGKSQNYEGGIRVPLIIRWPGVTEARSVDSTPVITNDLYPTFLDMAGIPLRAEQHLDGLSLAPLLAGTGSLDRSNLYFHYPHYQTMAPHGAVRSGDWKLVENYETGELELFDLKTDPGELNNLAKERPEVTETLRDYLHRHLDAIGAQMPEKNPDHKPGAEREGAGRGDFDAWETRQDEDPRPIMADPAVDAGTRWAPPV